MLKRTALNISILEDIESLNYNKTFFSKEIIGLELPIQYILYHSARYKVIKEYNIVGCSGILHQTDILPQSILCSEHEFERQLEFLPQKIKLLKSINCNYVSLSIDPYSDYSQDYAKSVILERLKVIKDKLSKNQIHILLEYISPKIFINNGSKLKKPVINGIEDILDIIYTLSSSNIYILLDYLHWYNTDSNIQLSDYIEFIGLVHICDFITSYQNIADHHRVLPFEGNSPLMRFMHTIINQGYPGYFSIEVFRHKKYTPSIENIVCSIKQVNEIISNA